MPESKPPIARVGSFSAFFEMKIYKSSRLFHALPDFLGGRFRRPDAGPDAPRARMHVGKKKLRISPNILENDTMLRFPQKLLAEFLKNSDKF